MKTIYMTVFLGLAETAESVSALVSVFHNLMMDVRDCYRPELHYMRGPGPNGALGIDTGVHDPPITFRVTKEQAKREAGPGCWSRLTTGHASFNLTDHAAKGFAGSFVAGDVR